MVNRLLSVDEDNNLPTDVHDALVGSVETYFEALTTQSEVAASNAQSAATVASNASGAAQIARDAAEAAAASASAPTDTMVSSLLADTASATNAAVGTLVASEYKTFLDTDFSDLQAAVNAATPGSTLRITKNYSLTSTVVVNKPLTLEFVSGSVLTTTTAINAVHVTSSDVTIRNITLVGTGNGSAGVTKALHLQGTVTAPLSNVHVINPHISLFNKDGIWLDFCTDFSVQNMNIHDMAYSGIIMISCTNGRITGGRIKNITRPTGFPQCYGIAMTRDSSLSLADSPRTENILVDGTTVENVNWEGIETHGGRNLTVTNNTVLGCHIGIAFVSCPDESGTDTYAPVGMICTNNYVDSRVSDGSKSNGIQLVGAGVLGGVIEYGSGVIANNIIVGYGGNSTNQGLWGGILAYVTRGMILSNNTIIRPGGAGIQLYHSNIASVITNTVVEDVWSDAGTTSAAIFVRTTTNNGTISGTQIIRGAKTATYVNTIGFYAVSAGSVTFIIDGSNRFSNATTAIQAPVSVVRDSFFGAPHVQQPTVRPAATDAASVILLANDLRAKLISLGLLL